MEPYSPDARRKRILHRARYRGFKEADILIGGFADAALGGMNEAELDAFEALLNVNDHEIYAWLTGASPPLEGAVADLIEKMRAFDAVAKIHTDSSA